jgi:predicted nucleic acid-binding protein
MSKIFIDTNILVYSMDRHDPEKREKCRSGLTALTRRDKGVISTQVLQEFYVACTKKLGADPLIVKNILQSFIHFELVIITPEIIQSAIDISILNALSFWDALIVSAAISANCEKIWTEDLNSGQMIRGVMLENPIENGHVKEIY